MIFAPENCDLTLKGIKGQTRRPRKKGDIAMVDGVTIAVYRKDRLLWRVGKTYVIKPGRTKKSVGRILLTGIRLEIVGEISREDVFAEGVYLLSQEFHGTSPGKEGPLYGYKLNGKCFCDADPRLVYLKAWKSFYPKSDFTEEVWVLTFSAVKS